MAAADAARGQYTMILAVIKSKTGMRLRWVSITLKRANMLLFYRKSLDKRGLTYLLVVSWGLIAGLRVEEINRMRPGAVMDLFIYRRNYDDQQHGIRRG